MADSWKSSKRFAGLGLKAPIGKYEADQKNQNEIHLDGQDGRKTRWSKLTGATQWVNRPGEIRIGGAK